MPLRKFFPAPYNENVPVKKIRAANTGAILSVSYNDSTKPMLFLSPLSSPPSERAWKEFTVGQRRGWSGYHLNLVITIDKNSDSSGLPDFTPSFPFSSVRGVSCAPLFQDTYYYPPACFQTDTSSLECYSLIFSVFNTQSRDDSPLAPSHSIQPIAFAGLRQRDTVCMLLPIIFDWTTWTQASLRTHFRCFGDGTLEVQFPTSAQMEQISLPNLASTTLSVGENSICAILPKGNVSLPSCWGGCIDTVKFGPTCIAPSSVNSTAIFLGTSHSCVINGDSKQLTCFGQLPGGIQPPQLPVLSASATSNMTCAILAVNQSLYCFGANSSVIPAVATATLRSSLGVVAASISSN
jgi:hypothetical protein